MRDGACRRVASDVEAPSGDEEEEEEEKLPDA
jgi:hypothetical protein